MIGFHIPQMMCKYCNYSGYNDVVCGPGVILATVAMALKLDGLTNYTHMFFKINSMYMIICYFVIGSYIPPMVCKYCISSGYDVAVMQSILAIHCKNIT